MTHLNPKRAANAHALSYASIPTQMRALRAYVPYILMPSKKGDGKQRKQAINPRTLKALDWNNPQDFVTLDRAEALLAANPRLNGVGICFKGQPIVDNCYLFGVDLDGVVNNDGSIFPHHLSILNQAHGYVETSVSGNGRHIFVLSDTPMKDFKCHDLGVELFASNGFIALTGNIDAKFNKPLSSKFNPAVLEPYKKNWQSNFDAFAADAQRDPEMSDEELRELVMSIRPPDIGRDFWIKMGMAIHHQTYGSDVGLEIWTDYSNLGYDNPEIYGTPAPDSELDYQWRSFKKSVQSSSMVTHKTLRYFAKRGAHSELIDLEDSPYDLEEAVATEFVIDGFIAEGIFILAGESGVGKTTLLLPLAALAAHLCVDDHALKPRLKRPVLYLTEDKKQAKFILMGLRKHCGVTKDDAEFNRWLVIKETKRMGKDRIAKLIREFAGKHKEYMRDVDGNLVLIPPLIVADTVAATFDLEDENNNAQVSKFISEVKLACSETGASLWLVAHIAKAINRDEVKNMSARGASAFGADAHGTGFIIKDEKSDSNKRFLIMGKKRYESEFNEVSFTTQTYETWVKNRLGQELPETYRVGTVERSSREDRKSQANQIQLDKEVRAVIASMHKETHSYYTKTLIGALTGMGTGPKYQKLQGLLDKLVADGRLIALTPSEAKAMGAKLAVNTGLIYQLPITEEFVV
jgi:RecA-family ATPase